MLVERDPNSVASRVLAFLRSDPEQTYRPTEIASEIGLTSTSVANALRVLTLRGDITRHRNTLVRNGPGASVYTYHEASTL
jgi:DNA-binding MarR family transcriptional regulator